MQPFVTTEAVYLADTNLNGGYGFLKAAYNSIPDIQLQNYIPSSKSFTDLIKLNKDTNGK